MRRATFSQMRAATLTTELVARAWVMNAHVHLPLSRREISWNSAEHSRFRDAHTGRSRSSSYTNVIDLWWQSLYGGSPSRVARLLVHCTCAYIRRAPAKERLHSAREPARRCPAHSRRRHTAPWAFCTCTCTRSRTHTRVRASVPAAAPRSAPNLALRRIATMAGACSRPRVRRAMPGARPQATACGRASC